MKRVADLTIQKEGLVRAELVSTQTSLEQEEGFIQVRGSRKGTPQVSRLGTSVTRKLIGDVNKNGR